MKSESEIRLRRGEYLEGISVLNIEILNLTIESKNRLVTEEISNSKDEIKIYERVVKELTWILENTD